MHCPGQTTSEILFADLVSQPNKGYTCNGSNAVKVHQIDFCEEKYNRFSLYCLDFTRKKMNLLKRITLLQALTEKMWLLFPWLRSLEQSQ